MEGIKYLQKFVKFLSLLILVGKFRNTTETIFRKAFTIQIAQTKLLKCKFAFNL